MKFETVRDLRGRSSQVWSTLARKREVILTSNGKPIAGLTAVSEDTSEASLTSVRRARAVASVETLQRRSALSVQIGFLRKILLLNFPQCGECAVDESGRGYECAGRRTSLAIRSSERDRPNHRHGNRAAMFQC